MAHSNRREARHRTSGTLAACLLWAGIVAGAPAAAGECPLPEGSGPELARVADTARLAFLRDSLLEEAYRVRLWTSAWAGAFLLLTAGQVAVAPVRPAAERPDWWIGAGTSTVGLVGMLALPMSVMDGGPVLDDFVRHLSPGADPCALVARGERWLALGADQEAFGYGWIPHVANVLVNAALLFAVGFGYDHWISAAINAAVGFAVGEAMILTQPTDLIDAWERYRAGTEAEMWPAS